MSITAVVPVWNGRDLLARLIASLESQTLPASELVVVDNGSTDGAPDLARSRGARIIPMGRNAGFAAGVNRGIRESKSEWIAVLNSDVELAPGYFAKLTAHEAWFATGKILSSASPERCGADPLVCAGPPGPAGPAKDPGASQPRWAGREDGPWLSRATSGGLIDGTFDAVCRGGTAWRVGSGRPDGPGFSESRRIVSPPWTAALFRAELFRRIGALEERFESYLEDVDFGLRCAAHGIDGIYEPAAIAWHRGSATLGRWHPGTVRRIARNQIWLVARHYPRRLLLQWLWPILVAHLLWGPVAARHGAGLAWVRGIIQGLGRFSNMRRQRKPGDEKVLERLLLGNDRLIYDFQKSTGFDTYWKLYFLLAGAGEL